MKKLTTLLLFCTVCAFAQVGIGTTILNNSAQLEIKASDKGLLIPKINLSNTTITSLDGTNTAATGLLIYNTNSSIANGNGVGFYYFNGTTWDKLTRNKNNVSSIPLGNSNFNINFTGGQDIAKYNSSIEPSIYNTAGKLEVKLVVRYSSSIGTTHLQLRVHDGSTQGYPITNLATDWTYATTQNGGVATSAWKSWNAGVNAHEIHLNGFVNPGASLVVESAYLLVRSQ